MTTVSALRLIIDARAAAAGAAAFSRATGQITTGATRAATANRGLVASMKPLAAFVGIAATVRTLAQFEEKMALAGKVSGATGKTLEALTAKARDLGATTRFTGAQAAEGLLQLARAGFDAEESMLAVADSLDLATAGGLALGEATGFMANSIRQFALDATDAARVADTFVVISNNANTDVRQMAEALKFAGTVAAALGLDIETAAAAIGVLGDRGVQGSMAGTQLRGTLLALASPTDKVTAALGRLNLEFDDVNPATNDFVQIAVALKAGVDGLANPLEAAGIFADIFGRRNAAAALAIAEANGKMQENIALAKESKSAHTDLANTMEQTLIGKFKALVSATEELMLSAGDRGLTGGLKSLIDIMTESFRMIGGLEGSFTKASAAGKVLTVVLTTMLARFVALKAVAIAGWIFGFAKAAWLAISAAGTFSAAMATLNATMALNPFVAVAMAVTALGTAMWMTTGRVEDQEARMRSLREEQEEYRASADTVAESVAKMNEAFALGQRSESIAALTDRLGQLRTLLDELQQGGGAVSAAQLGSGLAAADVRGTNLMAGWGGQAAGDGIKRAPESAAQRWLRGQPGGFGGTGGFEREASIEAVQKAIAKLQAELELLDPSIAAFAAGSDIAAVALDEWLIGNDALVKHLGQLGTTADETAVKQEALAIARKLASDATRTLTENEIKQLEDAIRARNSAEAAIKAQANAEVAAAKSATKSLKDWAKEQRAVVSAGKARKLANDAFVQSLKDSVGVMRLQKSGEDEAALALEINNTLRQRGIDLNSQLAVTIRELMTEQEHLNQIQDDGTIKLDEAAQAIQRFELLAKQQGIALEDLTAINGLHADAYELAAAKAQIAAEASALMKGATLGEMWAIMQARDAMLDYADATAELANQRALTQGVQDSFGDMFINIIDGSKSAAEAFEDFGKRTMAMIMDMVVKKALMNAMFGNGTEGSTGFLSFLFPAGGNTAARGAFAGGAGGFRRYASGGVVNRPTYFGAGGGDSFVAGEAGAPEGILPLKRDSRGNLGVISNGGGGGARTVIVNFKVYSNDPDSFRRSKVQIQNDLRRMTTQLEFS